MPYYIHERGIQDEPQEHARIAMFAKSDAVAMLQAGESVTFVQSDAERNAWRDREYRRLYGDAEGEREYLPLPFSTPWEHYAHRAKGDPEKVSYTPDAQYGHEDRRLVTTPVRYLEKYADIVNYSREQFAELAGKMRAGAMTLSYGTTAEEIARVYCAPGGPTSCMDGSDFDLENTPVRAYAGGDLSVAYLGKLGTSPSDDRIHARAMVWRERKQYVRAYGDLDAMHAALKADGYNKVSNWDGARLRAIKYDSRYWIVPYIDGGTQRLGHDGDWLIVGRGAIDGTNTCGHSRMVLAHTCDRCSEPCDEGKSYCPSCLDDSYTCYKCNDTEFGEGYTLGEEQYCPACYRAQRRNCEHCGTRYDSAEAESTEYCDSCYGDDGRSLCLDCRRRASLKRTRPLHVTLHNGEVTQSASTRWDSLMAWAERRY